MVVVVVVVVDVTDADNLLGSSDASCQVKRLPGVDTLRYGQIAKTRGRGGLLQPQSVEAGSSHAVEAGSSHARLVPYCAGN